MHVKMEDLVNYCKNYGFIFQGSEIYGGLSNTWDYGPLGVEIKENIRKCWWKKFIQEQPNNYGISSAILMNPEVWVASGHVNSFADPLIDCKKCKERFRADKIIEEYLFDNKLELDVNTMTRNQIASYIKENIKCPKCGASDYTDIREFNLLFETYQGVTQDNKSKIYLRGETAQGMFVNFANVVRSMRLKVPFGIGQTGKSFRNEITPGNFIFRTREFEQMELEFFCKPGSDLEWFGFYKNFCMNFIKDLGVKSQNLRFRDHAKEELSFYSKATTDIEYNFPFGWGELWGIADRTDYDLKVHKEHSKAELSYLDPETNERYIPYVIEPAVGLDRLFLMFICDAYKIQELTDGQTREVLEISPHLAPYKAVVLPLVKKYHADKAQEIYLDLCKYYSVAYDDTGSIGKRYRRSDAIGTPYAITIDDETMNNGKVTIRDRDNMVQEVIDIKDIKDYLRNNLNY